MEIAVGGNRELHPTTHITTQTSKRALEPVERISEIWFGLIMVLTFTCSISVSQAGRQEVRTLLIGSVGCNLAWGIIDSFMYLLACFVQRGTAIAKLRAVRSASDPGAAHRVIADALPPAIASVLSSEEFEVIRRKLNQLPEPPRRPSLWKKDWVGAGAVFLAVFLSISNVRLALRLSNGVALLMLFLTGYAFGLYADHHPWRMGLGMAVLGSILVGIAVVLGG
jgi:hypothetical protein